MQQSLILGLTFLALFATSAQAAFTISGTLASESPGGVLKLQRENLDKRSQTLEGKLTIATDQTFQESFGGQAGLFTLILSDQSKISLAIQDGQVIEIESDPQNANDYNINGSRDTETLQVYEQFRKESLARLVYPPRAILRKAKTENRDSETLEKLAQDEVDGYSAHLKELNDFVIDQLEPNVALYATSLRWDPDHRIAELSQVLQSFTDANPELDITQRMQEKLERFRATAIGSRAPALQGVDLDGTPHTLEQYRGKVILVDFWASWCTPCRVENQFYKELIETYSKHGFDLFAVNMDTSVSSWKRASQRDQITWPQISDSMAWKSPFASAYNVTALPANFLLDEQGKILARNLRGKQLEAKLNELLTN
ncbi:TlpA family protein disulfide reductase [Puniceicoccaceae bacterium K14]|nr:TlpA family protein disulfide reductase [Puniceicoccaceae bacterium K14]